MIYFVGFFLYKETFEMRNTIYISQKNQLTVMQQQTKKIIDYQSLKPINYSINRSSNPFQEHQSVQSYNSIATK